MCTLPQESLYFSESFIDSFRRFLYCLRTLRILAKKEKKLGEQIRSRRALIKMDPVRQLGFLLHSLSGTIFSVHAYVIVTAKYTIKNLTSSKIDNLLISLRVSASSDSSSSSFRSENSTIPSMLSQSLSPTEANPESGADVQTLLTYLWILVVLIFWRLPLFISWIEMIRKGSFNS